jgi:two-component system, sensor histidine kinase and response regulator
VGSTFSFVLKTSRAEASVAGVYSALPTMVETVGRAGTKRVLVVEDNPVNLEITRVMLGAVGCQVFVASNGLEAVAAVKEQTFDLILMDCQMPELDGYGATEAIRRLERENALPAVATRTPVIALTANAMEGDRERCVVSGMDDYLSKPFTRAQLLELLVKWLPDNEASTSSASH